MPNIGGCRLLWNTLFFVIETQDVQRVKEEFQVILKSLRVPALESLCVIAEALGTPAEKLQLLDEMQVALASKRKFGSWDKFQHRLLDEDDYIHGSNA